MSVNLFISELLTRELEQSHLDFLFEYRYWKTINVTPIYKKGAKADPGNYRPVSLTSVRCKILESIVKDTMMDHLLRKNLLSPSQHGFVPGRSCCTNLLEFLEKTTEVINQLMRGNRKPFDVVFLDFDKAFDKVPRCLRTGYWRSSGLTESEEVCCGGYGTG
jgi:hypothetical protein